MTRSLKEIKARQEALRGNREVEVPMFEEAAPKRSYKKLGIIAALMVTLGGLGFAFAAGGDQDKIGTDSQEQVKSEEIQIQDPAANAVHTQQDTLQKTEETLQNIEEALKTMPQEVKVVEVEKPVVVEKVKVIEVPAKTTPIVQAPKTTTPKVTTPKTTVPKTAPKSTTPKTTPKTETVKVQEPKKVPVVEYYPEMITLLERGEIFDKPNGSKKSSLEAQTVIVKGKEGKWFKIQSWLGDVWIKPASYYEGTFQLVLKDSESLYTEKKGTKMNQTITPQTVNAQKRDGDWFLINSYHGNLWVNPKNFEVKGTATQNSATIAP